MTKEQIDQLAAKRYPIGDNVSDNDRDTLEMFRRIYSEGLTKASEILYTEEQVRDAWDDGSWNIEDKDRIKNRELYIQSLK